MHKIYTEVLVIGGGATGTGVLRDLAMRGFKTILVERRDLTHGTTGRFHGLLHSGGRYAVKDPAAAHECIEENRILRKIMPHCIEDSGGYFVLTPDDDPNYANMFLRGCNQAGIPVDEVPISQMLTEEPYLNPEISRCFRVPDGAADGFAAAHTNVASAIEYGAQVFTYHEVEKLLTRDHEKPDVIIGALCHDLVKDVLIEFHADLVVNAAGAWVGKIGATAGLEIAIRPGKGTMIAVSHRIVNTVVNRLKMPSDGDILVPAHTVAVMGTTDEQVSDPDSFAIIPWEVQLMLKEGEKIIPGFSQLRMLRAWAGVRPLYQETKTDQSRDITRSFVLLDHEERDGIPGLLTITSGKWTTYRKMAEFTVNKVCEKLDTQRKCRTHLEMLPTEDGGRATGKHHYLGERLTQIEREKTYGQLICECELATRADIENAIIQGQAKTLDDVRRDARLGMGPCQGGFCTLRAAGILHQLSANIEGSSLPSSQTKNTNLVMRDFLQERWKGLLPILWGKQLRQESLNELIYLNVLNIDKLPGLTSSRLGSENYSKTEINQPTIPNRGTINFITNHTPHPTPHSIDTIIIGAGLAGLTAAWRLTTQGKKVKVVAKGWGATHWASGCIDILGYSPHNRTNPINTPTSAIARLGREQPDHLYAKISLEKFSLALKAFQELCAESGYPLQGSLEHNWLLPTAAGTIRPTCLAPETFIAGDLTDPSSLLLVGIEGFNDFYPHLVAANLQTLGFPSKAIMIQLPGLQNRHRIDSMVLAHYFDDPDTAAELAATIKPHLGNAARVGLPAVLGMKNTPGFVRVLESLLGRRIFEIPGLPPSVAGMRLYQILVEAIQKSGGQVFQGMEVIGAELDETRVDSIYTEAAARPTRHTAKNYILATGGILGGGVYTNHTGAVYDPIFDIPIQPSYEKSNWANRNFLHPDGHPIFGAGVKTDKQLQNGYENLFIIGNALSGDFVRERSLEGVALLSAFHVGEMLA